MTYLIAGLGNPEEAYAHTRHNIGFRILNSVSERLSVAFEQDRHGWTANSKYKGRSLLLLKPNTYMNLSGKAVAYHLSKQKIPIYRLLVLVDELSLPFGQLRLRGKGSAGGHNGLQNIIEHIGASYARLRFGIGGAFQKGAQVKYVLSTFTQAEEATLSEPLQKAVDMTLAFCTIGLDRTMNASNCKL